MIHKYNMFGYNIVLDVESGAIHAVSDIAYKILDYLSPSGAEPLEPSCPMDIRYELAKYSSGEINEAYSEIVGLYNDGLLFSQPPVITADNTATPVKALCLYITHDCNLNCRYCFASGSYSSEKMSADTGIKAIEYLMQNSGNRKNLEVDFFGGEPLLNFDTVREIVVKTKELEKIYDKNVRFTLTTNGTLLNDEIIDFINENITNIVLSLDGDKSVNDKMRGEGVYDAILPMYQTLVKRRSKEGYTDYYVRGTFTRNNLDFSKDVLHFAELGFRNISVEPVIAPDDADYSIRMQDLPQVFAEYETLAREMIRRYKRKSGEFNFFHFNIDIENGPCIYKRIKGCGSGSEYIAVTPNGNIYPCHQFAGNTDYKLGNIADKQLDISLMGKFRENNILTNPACASCWVKYYCGGGCAANNANFCGDITEPYKIACETEKKRIECAIVQEVIKNS